MKNIKLIFVFAFIFAAFVFLAHYWVVGSGVWGDGRYYYNYARSLVVDKNLDFSNEMEHFGEPIVLTKTGKVANKYSIGPAIFWLPIFFLTHLVARGDGYSHIYQILVGLESVAYGILGLYLCFKICQNWFEKKIALTAVFGLWLASNLFFYTAVDPINSHSVSFFVASLIIYFVACKPASIPRNIILGLLIGLLGSIRSQDLIFGLPLLILTRSPFFLSAVLVGFFPQLLAWKFLYGEVFSPYLLGGEKFNWLNPQILPVLFSQNNGLFYYSPILIIALTSFFLLYRKKRFLTLMATFLFFAQTYIVSSWHIWWGGAAYGGRMFISLMPLFIAGLAAFWESLGRRQRLCYPLLLVLIVFNFYSMIKFLLISP